MTTPSVPEMLDRIDYRGPIAPDLDCLRGVHRSWRERVPYENLDIQLGKSIDLDDEALYDKIIRRRRGGYCFEQNGTLALLLRAIGFDVTMVEGGVLREPRGDEAWGNHNVLLVDVDGQRWVADVGIGDGFREPLPLSEGRHRQDGLDYRLERLDARTWRLHEPPSALVASYDFHTKPARLTDFTTRNRQLSTAPDSPYVTTLMIALPDGTGTALLLSRTLRKVGPGAREPEKVAGPEQFASLLRDRFDVSIDDLGSDAITRLWHMAQRQDDLWRSRSTR